MTKIKEFNTLKIAENLDESTTSRTIKTMKAINDFFYNKENHKVAQYGHRYRTGVEYVDTSLFFSILNHIREFGIPNKVLCFHSDLSSSTINNVLKNKKMLKTTYEKFKQGYEKILAERNILS